MMVLVFLSCAAIVLCGWALKNSHRVKQIEFAPEDRALGSVVMCFGVLGAVATAWAMKGGAA